MVGELEHRVAQLQVRDPHARRDGMVEVVDEAEVLLVEPDRAVQVGDVQGGVVDALVHGPPFSQYTNSELGRGSMKLLLALLAVPLAAAAQPFPSKPIRVISDSAAGSPG